MTRRQMNEFLDFLKDNDLYDEYVHELWDQKRKTIKSYMDSCRDDKRLITDAFHWTGSSGRDQHMAIIWSLLDRKWQDYLRENE